MIGQHISQRRLIPPAKADKVVDVLDFIEEKVLSIFSDRILSEICPFKYLFNRYFDGVI